jgi:hypothetical protein
MSKFQFNVSSESLKSLKSLKVNESSYEVISLRFTDADNNSVIYALSSPDSTTAESAIKPFQDFITTTFIEPLTTELHDMIEAEDNPDSINEQRAIIAEYTKLLTALNGTKAGATSVGLTFNSNPAAFGLLYNWASTTLKNARPRRDNKPTPFTVVNELTSAPLRVFFDDTRSIKRSEGTNAAAAKELSSSVERPKGLNVAQSEIPF